MKIETLAINQGRSPQYQTWGHIWMGGRTIPCLGTFTSIGEITHYLSTVTNFPRMKLGYVWWGFHRLIRRSPVYRVLDGSGVTSSTAGLFVGYTIVRNIRSLSSSPPWALWWGLHGQVLRFPSWMRGASGLPIEGLEKEEDCPKWRLVWGDRILELCPTVIQILLKGAQKPS